MKKYLTSTAYASMTWFIGVCIYLASYSIPILDAPELQANIALAITMIPNACLGTYLFYRKATLPPFWLGVLFVAVAVVLDALVTVPLFIVPDGGTYQEFFGNYSFYLIASEYFLAVLIFGHSLTKHKPHSA